MSEREELIRKACLAAARRAFEEASMSGLCAEGALEAALGAIEQLDLSKLECTELADAATAHRQRERASG